MHQLLVRVHGRVQGVGFRWFVAQRARELAVNGCVANRSDGSVELQAEGDPEVLERLLDSVRRGPPHAAVSDVEVTRSEGPSRFTSFGIE